MAITPVYSNSLASNSDEGGFQPFQLFAGESDIVTSQAPVLSGLNLAQFTVLAMNAAGKLVVHAPAGAAPLNQAVGILAQPINATAGDVIGPYYVGGVFNHEALVWAAATNTLDLRRAAFSGTNITIGKLL